MNTKTKHAIDFASRICYSSKQTINNTYQTARYAVQNGIQGDFVQIGVAAGAQIIVAAAVLEQYGSDKKIFAIDSFQGISMASKFDSQQPGIGNVQSKQQDFSKLLVSSGITVHGLDQVKRNIQSANIDLGRFVFMKGWVQNVLPIRHNQIEKISWYRTDVDMYFPTKFGLQYLFPKISAKAPVIADDWALDGCRLAFEQYFYSIGYTPTMLKILNSTPEFFYK